jgi:hypothetical protein
MRAHPGIGEALRELMRSLLAGAVFIPVKDGCRSSDRVDR